LERNGNCSHAKAVVLWRADYNSNSGFGSEAREFIRALVAMDGYQIQARSKRKDKKDGIYLSEEERKFYKSYSVKGWRL
jgi:hypothetical protein